MSVANLSPEVIEQVKAISQKPYKDQMITYLNAFWHDGGEAEAEDVWTLHLDFIKEDHNKGKDGNELNPVQAFHLLQGRNQALTALELKAQLRTVDIDANGEMSLAEYLLFINKRDVTTFVKNAATCASPENALRLKKIEEQLAELNKQYEQLVVQLEEQKETEAAAKNAENQAIVAAEKAKADEGAAKHAEQQAHDDAEKAKTAEEAAAAAEAKLKELEEEVRKVEEEARAVDASLKAEQDAFEGECARLEATSKDESLGIVKRNTAAQQLAGLKSSDPLPLKKAKILQEATVRRVTKARQAAEAETAVASAARQEAADAREKSEQAAQAATAAREQAEVTRKLAEEDKAKAVEARAKAEEKTKEVEASIDSIKQNTAALEEELETVKHAASVPMGAIWVAEKELKEKKARLPTRFQ